MDRQWHLNEQLRTMMSTGSFMDQNTCQKTPCAWAYRKKLAEIGARWKHTPQKSLTEMPYRAHRDLEIVNLHFIDGVSACLSGIEIVYVYKDTIFSISYNIRKFFYRFYGAILDSHGESLLPLDAESFSCVRQAGSRSCVEPYKNSHCIFPIVPPGFCYCFLYTLLIYDLHPGTKGGLQWQWRCNC
jgi:hypothetical protein